MHMKRRLLAAGLALVTIPGVSACAGDGQTVAGPAPTPTRTATPTSSATPSAATTSPGADTETAPPGSPPGAAPRTTAAPAAWPATPPSAGPASTTIQPPGPAPTSSQPTGPSSGDVEACNSARYANTLMLTLIMPLATFYDPDSTPEEVADARNRIVNVLEQGASALAEGSARATSPSIKAALNDARAVFATAAGTARTGSVQDVLALFESGFIDAPLIRVFDLCNA